LIFHQKNDFFATFPKGPEQKKQYCLGNIPKRGEGVLLFPNLEVKMPREKQKSKNGIKDVCSTADFADYAGF